MTHRKGLPAHDGQCLSRNCLIFD